MHRVRLGMVAALVKVREFSALANCYADLDYRLRRSVDI